MVFPILDLLEVLHYTTLYMEGEIYDKAYKAMVQSMLNMMKECPEKDALTSSIEKYGLKYNDSYFNGSYILHQSCTKILFKSEYISLDEFTKRYSKDNIIITNWSHPEWKLIHYFGKNCPKDKWENYKAYMSCKQYLLPCKKCRAHLIENLKIHPMDSYRDNLFIWSYILHQIVNTQLKKDVMPSLTDAYAMYP